MLSHLFNMSGSIIWVPEKFLNINMIKNANKFAVIVLNRPITADKDIIESLWNHAAIRITVDGGTNRWLSWLRRHKLENTLKHPNLITGDMDSCLEESLTFFSESRVIKTPDQNETDFTKSLHVLTQHVEEMFLENVIALCETSGRIDQILGNINTLFKNLQKPSEVSRPVFILSDNSISWLLSEGHHQIHIPESVKKLWCALVPFEPTTVTTTGLKWNLENRTMKFGGMVSTSNKYDEKEDIVKITTDHPVLWSMGISTIDE